MGFATCVPWFYPLFPDVTIYFTSLHACVRAYLTSNSLICVFQDVKCSGNWMWAAKLPGEGASLWDACKAMCEVMGRLGVAIDGGKDSLSMAARVGKETVKAPGTLSQFTISTQG